MIRSRAPSQPLPTRLLRAAAPQASPRTAAATFTIQSRCHLAARLLTRRPARSVHPPQALSLTQQLSRYRAESTIRTWLITALPIRIPFDSMTRGTKSSTLHKASFGHALVVSLPYVD